MNRCGPSVDAQFGDWLAGSATVPGQQHAQENVPCQDAAQGSGGARPFVLTCDGRGSSALSHLGSSAAVTAFANTVGLLEPLLARYLDNLDCADPLALAGWKDVSRILLPALVKEQEKLAVLHGAPSAQFEFTLSAAVVGKAGVGVLQLGDSGIIFDRSGHTFLAAKQQQGEFQGETFFVCPMMIDHAETLLLPAHGLNGIVAFTDGIGGRWLHHQTKEPAPVVGHLLRQIALGGWDEQCVRDYLGMPFWIRGGDDDRGLAFLVRRQGSLTDKPTGLPPGNIVQEEGPTP